MRVRVKFHYKIVGAIILVASLILLGSYVCLSAYFSSKEYNIIRSGFKNNIDLAKTYLEEVSPGLTRTEMSVFARKMENVLGVRVTVIDDKGKVLGDSSVPEKELDTMENHYERPEVRSALDKGFGESRRFSTTIKKDMLYLAVTFNRGSEKGILRFAVPLSAINEIEAKVKRGVLIIFFIAFLCAIAVGVLVSRIISMPLEMMTNDIDMITKEGLSRRIHIRGDNEIAVLAGVFNGLLDKAETLLNEVKMNRSSLEAILVSMPEGVMALDNRGEILFANKAFERLIALESGYKGRRPLEVLRNVEIQQICDEVLAGAKRVFMREVSIFYPEKKIFAVNAVAIMKEEALEGVVMVLHDITELRRLEMMRRDFVANVSHELRTPLSCIKGYAETLLDGALKEPDNATEFVRIIYENSARLENLVRDILELSRLESDKLEINVLPCHLYTVAERAVSVLKKRIQEKEITLKNDISLNTSKVLADESLLLQVFFNLMDNAIKYTQNGGAIVVSASETEKLVEISVADNGIGIAEKDLPRVFERFYCVDKARSREMGGTGLGLSIVKHIVQSHKGEVSVKSVLGAGTTFIVRLPKA